MKSLMSLAVIMAVTVAPLWADVTPSDIEKAGNDAARTVNKNVHQAVDQATGSDKKAAAPKKKHHFFDAGELHKDRSLPAGDKVKTTDDGKKVDPPYKHLGEELHKQRG